MATTLRIDEKLHARLREIADAEDRSLEHVLEDALRQYQREKFREGAQVDVARLRSDPAAWQSYQDDIALWDSTSGDGLEDEDPYYTPEEEAEIDADYARTYGR